MKGDKAAWRVTTSLPSSRRVLHPMIPWETRERYRDIAWGEPKGWIASLGSEVKGHNRGRSRSSEHKRRRVERPERRRELQVELAYPDISTSRRHVSQDLESLNLSDTTSQLGDMQSKEISATSSAKIC